MNRVVVNSRVSSDGKLHISLPAGEAEAHQDVRVTIEPITPPSKAALPMMTAAELLNSGLVGIWADRTDIGDTREFARRLRDQAQSRSRDK
jgi:hypothetical protein